MSDVIPHTRVIERLHNLRAYTSEPVTIDYREGQQRPIVHLRDGKNGAGSCLGCYNSPCINLHPSELAMPVELAAFPGSPSLEVCPTDAISWEKDLRAPVVTVDMCIGCGLCASRCPYGGISLLPSGVATVHNDDPDILTTPELEAKETYEFTPERLGSLGKMNAHPLRNFPDSVAKLTDGASSILVRNLLAQVGISCRIRRKGDTNMRIDAVGILDNGRVAVIEIELSNAVLESPRALLEDVAVLHGRYNIDISRIDPISVILTLPNERSEYYQVISDIKEILNLRCRTITLGALLIMVWHFCKLNSLPHDLFETSIKDNHLLIGMRKIFSEKIPLIEPYLGALYPIK
jgi:ferredoxin